MKIIIAAVGKLKERYLTEGIAIYTKRLKPFADIICKEIPEAPLSHNPSPAEIKAAIADEGERLLRSVPPGSFFVALSLEGKMIDSKELAEKIAAATTRGKSTVAFAIGGTFGIDATVTKAADFTLCLSPLTFTHQMTRLILSEQIYRAFKINAREKYHW